MRKINVKIKKLIAKYWVKRTLWFFVCISQRKKASNTDNCPTFISSFILFKARMLITGVFTGSLILE